jgi:hypothetical protein
MTDWTTPPPPGEQDEYDERNARQPRRFRAVLVVLVLVVAGVGAYLFWPEPTLDDQADVDAALVAEADMPGFSTWGRIEGSLPQPAGGDDPERTVLTGAALAETCEDYRSPEDSWACPDLQGMGWVGLVNSANAFFRLLSMVLAYEDEGAAEAAYESLVAGQRRAVPEEDRTESAPDLGDECVSFQFGGATSYAIRIGTVVVELFISDGSEQVDESEERATAEELATNQLDKIEEALG